MEDQDWIYDYDSNSDYGYEEWENLDGYSDYSYDNTYDEWDYYGGQTYYMDEPKEKIGIMEQIQNWFSGDHGHNALSASALVLTVLGFQI